VTFSSKAWDAPGSSVPTLSTSAPLGCSSLRSAMDVSPVLVSVTVTCAGSGATIRSGSMDAATESASG